jgi:hypothetical protein
MKRNRKKELSTIERAEQFEGKQALLSTWESQSQSTQNHEHSYLKELRGRVRQVKTYLIHRKEYGS